MPIFTQPSRQGLVIIYTKPPDIVNFLFPFYRACGFCCEVVEDAADAGDFVHYALCDVVKKLVGNLFDCGAHGVYRVDGADYDKPLVCALAVSYADGLHVGNGCEILPYLACETVFVKLLAEDCVGLSYSLKAVTGDGAEAADTETGSGEGLTEDHVVRQTEGLTDHSDFVLVEQLEGFNQLEFHIFGQTAHIVVGFYTMAFDDVGVDCALSE